MSAIDNLIYRKLDQSLQKLSQLKVEVPSFEVSTNGSKPRKFGNGASSFSIDIITNRGRRSLASMDETRIAEAYMNGDLDFQGDIREMFKFRDVLGDQHPLRYLWVTYLQPLFFRQKNMDKKWISEHYDYDQDFYLLFLDKSRSYSQGVFENDSQDITTAMKNKMEYAIQSCGLKSGDSVLDIGGGWGTFVEFAGKKDINVTSVTISKESEQFVKKIIDQERLPCSIRLEHFFDHNPPEPYDAIVNMGVTEHLPDYKSTLKKYTQLLKKGGRVYLDASAARVKHKFSSFIYRYIFPGNPSPLCLHDYITELDKSPLELIEVKNDRHSYALTLKYWAEALERNAMEIIERFGEELYRKFKLYLWGTEHAFKADIMTAYRMVLELPRESRKFTRWQ